MTTAWPARGACTLPTADQPLRVAEFASLFERHLVRAEHPEPTRASLVLRGDDKLEATVRDLAGREAQCCSFFAFEIPPQPAQTPGCVQVRLDIEVPPARAHVLDALVEQALAARAHGLHVG
jgi:hypothetical protein